MTHTNDQLGEKVRQDHAIRHALASYWGMDDDEIHMNHVHVIKNYMPDGPGWVGDLAWVVYGECCFQTLLKRDPGKDWTVEYDINDMTPTSVPLNGPIEEISKEARDRITELEGLNKLGIRATLAFEAQNIQLLAALKGALTWLSSYPGGGALKAYDKARAAIATAKGGDNENPDS